MLALRRPRLWLAISWMLIALAILASLAPAQHVPHPPVISDKIEHAAAYMLLSLWFAGIYPRSRYLLIAAGLFALGVAVEWAQGAMQLGRHADFRDVAANTIGILVGLALAWVWFGGWVQRIEAWTRRP